MDGWRTVTHTSLWFFAAWPLKNDQKQPPDDDAVLENGIQCSQLRNLAFANATHKEPVVGLGNNHLH